MVAIRIGELGPDGSVQIAHAWLPDGNVSNEIFSTLPTWQAHLRALGLGDLPKDLGTYEIPEATARLYRQRCRDFLNGRSATDGRSEDAPELPLGHSEEVDRQRRMARWLATWLDGAVTIQITE